MKCILVVRVTSCSFCNDMVVYLCFVSLADTTKNKTMSKIIKNDRFEKNLQLLNIISELFGFFYALSVLVVDPEDVLQLPLQGEDVGVLHQELRAQLAELVRLDLPESVLVDLGQDVHQLLLAGAEPHGLQDLVQVVGRQRKAKHPNHLWIA